MLLIAHSVDKTNGSDKIQYSVAEAQPDLPGQKTCFHEHTQSIEGRGLWSAPHVRSISTFNIQKGKDDL